MVWCLTALQFTCLASTVIFCLRLAAVWDVAYWLRSLADRRAHTQNRIRSQYIITVGAFEIYVSL
jgi:hypothetical protein